MASLVSAKAFSWLFNFNYRLRAYFCFSNKYLHADIHILTVIALSCNCKLLSKGNSMD